MKFLEFMEQQQIAARVAEHERVLGRRADRQRQVDEQARVPEHRMYGKRPHFPNLPMRQREILAKKGIDPERSFREFMLEIKVVGPPDLLIEAIFGSRVPTPRQVDERFGMRWAA